MGDWERVVAFHGPPCCLPAIGYRAAKPALERLGAGGSTHGLVWVVRIVRSRGSAFDQDSGVQNQVFSHFTAATRRVVHARRSGRAAD